MAVVSRATPTSKERWVWSARLGMQLNCVWNVRLTSSEYIMRSFAQPNRFELSSSTTASNLSADDK